MWRKCYCPIYACGTLAGAFAELLTSALYARYRFPRPPGNEFSAFSLALSSVQAVPLGVQNALHGMRKEGNQAAHGGELTTERAFKTAI